MIPFYNLQPIPQAVPECAVLRLHADMVGTAEFHKIGRK